MREGLRSSRTVACCVIKKALESRGMDEDRLGVIAKKLLAYKQKQYKLLTHACQKLPKIA